jgi:2'-5' RNA ligase
VASVRCFIVIGLPQATIDTLEAVSCELSSRVEGVRWVKPQNIHLTLRFLGDVEENRLNAIRGVIDNVSSEHGTLHFDLDEIGAFPNSGKARVIWVGLSGDLLGLNALQRDISDAMETCGFEPEPRPFRPHLTLGRARDPIVLPAIDEMVSSAPFEGTRLRLIRSELGQGGARYTDLHAVSLKKS